MFIFNSAHSWNRHSFDCRMAADAHAVHTNSVFETQWIQNIPWTCNLYQLQIHFFYWKIFHFCDGIRRQWNEMHIIISFVWPTGQKPRISLFLFKQFFLMTCIICSPTNESTRVYFLHVVSSLSADKLFFLNIKIFVSAQVKMGWRWICFIMIKHGGF